MILCILAYVIQMNMELHKDVAILSHQAGLMLQGQTYGHNIFEPNPPLILYLNFIPVIISKITGIKLIYVLRLCILILIIFSVVCARNLLSVLFKHNEILIGFMTYGLTGILLFLPADAFGQREHLLLMFTIPYLFLAVCRIENKNIKPSFAFLIGIMAGIGFSLKPFFLPTLLLIELFVVYRKKSLWGCCRIESISVLLVMFSYVAGVILFYPNYWHIVVPLWIPYYQVIVMPWLALLTCPLFLFCCAACVSYGFTAKNDEYVTVKTVFILSITGYLVTFLIPRVAWYYHILPAISMASLYFALVLGELTDQLLQSSKRVIAIGIISLLATLIFCIPVYYSWMLTMNSMNNFHSNNPINKLIAFLNRHQQHNTYDFYSMTHQLSVLEFYSTAKYVGSFATCGWEYARLLPSSHYDSLPFAVNILSQDLDNKQPAFVIVDIPSTQAYLHTTVDFPKEYAQHKNFRDAWSHYQYFGSIKPYDLYRRVS